MKKIRLGRTGIMVTQPGFGGIPIQRLSEEEAIAVVQRCLELGVNFIDTANGYTTSEERIGKAIKGKRADLILATKSTGRTKDEVTKHIKLSLERMGVDYIDLFQFHNLSDAKALEAVLSPDGPMAAAEEAKESGVIKHIGVTSHQVDTAKEAVKTNQFETIMFPFNIISHEPAEELLALAKKEDVGFIAMKPFAGGALDNARLTIKYLCQFPDVLLIPGIQHTEEIEEIAGILNGSSAMTLEDQQEIERIRLELGNKFCRRCDYCLPCTEDIPISFVMHYPTFLKRLAPAQVFSGGVADAMEKAANCSKCGECEPRCPYDLPIMEYVEEYANKFKEDRNKYR